MRRAPYRYERDQQYDERSDLPHSFRYLFPRLLASAGVCLPPVECSPGTTLSHVAKPRPFLKADPFPIAAIVAVFLEFDRPRHRGTLRTPAEEYKITDGALTASLF